MVPEFAPKPGCNCSVCAWLNRIAERERRLEEDLAANYERYEAGELVSKPDED